MASPTPRGKAPTALVWCSSVHPAGGMERIALNLANGLAARGWRMVLAGPFARIAFLRRAIRPDVEFVNYDAGRSPAALPYAICFLKRTMEEHGVQVVSAHGSVFPLLASGVPVVWTEHDVRYAGGEMLRGLRGFAWRRVRERLRQGRWRLVTVSHYVQREICGKLNLPDQAVRVIYNGLPNAAALEALAPPRLAPPWQIGFLGRLVPPKRPLDVFELSARLNRMDIPHVWRVFGAGVLLPEMQREAAARGGHSVVLQGLVERPEEALAQMDLLCFLARGEQEGLGMVLLEALAAHRLIVAWDAGCIREVLAGRATLVPPPFDLDRFAQAIAETLRPGPLPARAGQPLGRSAHDLRI